MSKHNGCPIAQADSGWGCTRGCCRAAARAERRTHKRPRQVARQEAATQFNEWEPECDRAMARLLEADFNATEP
jgi:hypothetical protein